MQRHQASSWKRHTLWLSILAHVLLLLSLVTFVVSTPPDKLPSTSPQSIQSYLTPSPPAPPAPPAPEQQQAMAQATPLPPQPPVKAEPAEKPQPKQADKNGIEKPIAVPVKETRVASKPKASRAPHKPTFARDAVPEDITNPRDEEPLHLIGESRIIKPLVQILSRALSRHLRYPRVAAELNLRGIVLVGFVIHPEGYVTEARVVKSSGAGVLDDAARDAVGAMSPVGDVHEYVPEPEFLVVGIIFG